MYYLESDERCPLNGSLNTILQLELFCQRAEKEDEIPYVQAFISLHNEDPVQEHNVS